MTSAVENSQLAGDSAVVVPRPLGLSPRRVRGGPPLQPGGGSAGAGGHAGLCPGSVPHARCLPGTSGPGRPRRHRAPGASPGPVPPATQRGAASASGTTAGRSSVVSPAPRPASLTLDAKRPGARRFMSSAIGSLATFLSFQTRTWGKGLESWARGRRSRSGGDHGAADEPPRASRPPSWVLSSAVTGPSATRRERAWPPPQHSRREAAGLGPRVLVYRPPGSGAEAEFSAWCDGPEPARSHSVQPRFRCFSQTEKAPACEAMTLFSWGTLSHKLRLTQRSKGVTVARLPEGTRRSATAGLRLPRASAGDSQGRTSETWPGGRIHPSENSTQGLRTARLYMTPRPASPCRA